VNRSHRNKQNQCEYSLKSQVTDVPVFILKGHKGQAYQAS